MAWRFRQSVCVIRTGNVGLSANLAIGISNIDFRKKGRRSLRDFACFLWEGFRECSNHPCPMIPLYQIKKKLPPNEQGCSFFHAIAYLSSSFMPFSKSANGLLIGVSSFCCCFKYFWTVRLSALPPDSFLRLSSKEDSFSR